MLNEGGAAAPARRRTARKRLLTAGWCGAVLAAICAAGFGMAAVKAHSVAAQVEREVPPAGRFVELDGHRFHYLEQGQGRPILFLHGLSGSLLQLSAPLFPRLDGFRLVAVDRAGSGYSERGSAGEARLSRQAEQVSQLIARLGLGKVLVVGHSLGGTLALQLALDHPEQVAGLALLAPVTQPTDQLLGESKYLLIRPDFLRVFAAYTVAVPFAERAYGRGNTQSFGPQEPPPDYDAAGGGRLILRPEALLNASRDAVALVDGPELAAMQPRLGELKMPVGVLFGARDRLLSAKRETAGLSKAIPQLEMRRLRGVGHMVQFAKPDETADFIRLMARRAFGS